MTLLDVVVWVGGAVRWVLSAPWWAGLLAVAAVVALAVLPRLRDRR